MTRPEADGAASVDTDAVATVDTDAVATVDTDAAATVDTDAVATVDVAARPRVLVRRMHADLPGPVYALPGDAGADVVAATDLTLEPGERAVLPTGLAIALPPGYAAFVHPRSGLAARAGLGLVNAPGTIDEGYRGEIKLIVVNHDTAATLNLSRGERVAQLVIQQVAHAEFVEVNELPESVRGTGGHGSTGGAAALASAPSTSALTSPTSTSALTSPTSTSAMLPTN